MAGRKSKLTKELIDEAVNLIKLGNYACVVANYLGVSESTWYRWLQEGEQAKSGLKREFWESIKKAEAVPEIRNVKIIQQAAEENWQAAMTYLQRRFPERWGRRDFRVKGEIQHTGKDGGSIELENKINLDKLTDQELMILEKLLASEDTEES